ncbi:MAG: hypothetical protein ABWZ40_03120 [Caulobacterales bacterium]
MKLRAVALAVLLTGCAGSGAGKAPPASIAVGEPSPNGAGAPNAPGGVSKADQPIDFGDWKGAQNPDQLSDAFAAQIDARYGPEPGLLAVKKDLEANGFVCRDVPPVEARGDYLVAACDRQEMLQSCNNIWSVSLRFDHNSRALDATRVTARGGFERLCLGANPN